MNRNYLRVPLICGTALFLCFELQNLVTRGVYAGSKDIQSPPPVSPVIDLIWKRQVGRPVWLESSPDGNYIGVVTSGGRMYCLDNHGRLVWRAAQPGVDRVAVGNNASAVAYTFLNPAGTIVYLIGPSGEISWDQEVTGAVWTAAAARAPGLFAIGTGERYCYVYTFSERRHRYRRWKLPGAPCTTAFAPDSKSLVFGTWQEAGVGRFDLYGHEIEWRDGEPDRLHAVDLCRSGAYSVVLATPNSTLPDTTVRMQNSSLDPLWSKDFPGRNLAADIAPGGEYIVIGYRRAIAHKNEQIWENRVALFNRGGEELWEKGGLFGKWNLMQACASGNLLLYDEAGSLFLLGQSGKMLLRRELPSGVRSFINSPARTRVAVLCKDGQLCVFDVR